MSFTPNANLSTLRPDIGEALHEFDLMGNLESMIAYDVLPVTPVEMQRGVYPFIPVESLLQTADTKRNSKSGYNVVDFEFGDRPFACSEHGLASPIDDRLRAAYKDFFEKEVETAKILNHVVWVEAEKRVAAKVFNPTTFSAYTAGITNEWDSNHTSDATPITDVQTAKDAIYARTGVWPNALIINRTVFQNLRRLDSIIDAIQSAGAGSATKLRDITANMLAQVFDLDMVLVAGGTKNLADEGQDFSPSQVWSSEYAMVAKICTTTGFSEPGLGRTFHWAEDGSQPGGTIETFRDEHLRRDIVRVRHDVDEQIVEASFGQLLSNVTTI